jgi:hypothetical protein
MAKPRHSKRDGKWDERLACHVQQLTYDFRTQTGSPPDFTLLNPHLDLT